MAGRTRQAAHTGPDSPLPQGEGLGVRSDALVFFGDAVKALGDGRVGGYLVRFGGPDDTDAEGEFFTSDTDFDLEPGRPVSVYYHHGLDRQIGKKRIGRATMTADEAGIRAEAQLQLRDAAGREIYRMAEAGRLGWSSGAVGHLVQREPAGKATWIRLWPIGEASLTPTPSEPRNVALPIKALTPPLPLPLQEEGSREGSALASLGGEEAPGMGHGAWDEAITPSFTQQESITMSEQEQAPAAGADVEAIKQAAAEVAAQAAVEAVRALAGERPAPAGGVALPAINPSFGVKRVTSLGFADDDMQALRYYIRTGDQGAVRGALKAALVEGTGASGGYVVPPDFYAQIIAKRNELSIARLAGATSIKTSLPQINIPTEGTSQAAFVITSEGGSVDENEPTFGQVNVPVYRFTKLVKASVEVLADQAANLDEFLVESAGRAYAVTENKYFLTGTGSGQPQGAFVGGTAAMTFAGAAAITAAEVVTLRHKLAAFYAPEAVWVTRNATVGSLRGLSGNFWQFAPTPMGNPGNPGGGGILWDLPVYLSDQVGAMATGQKSLMVSNFAFYGIVERQEVTVQRLNELYAGTGQVGLLWSFREGGAVLQAEAFQYGTQA